MLSRDQHSYVTLTFQPYWPRILRSPYSTRRYGPSRRRKTVSCYYALTGSHLQRKPSSSRLSRAEQRTSFSASISVSLTCQTRRKKRRKPKPREPPTKSAEPWSWTKHPRVRSSAKWFKRWLPGRWQRKWPSSASKPTCNRARKCSLRASSTAVATAAATAEAALKASRAKAAAALKAETEAERAARPSLPGEAKAAMAQSREGDQPRQSHHGGGNLLPVASRGKTPGEAGDLAPAGLQAPSTEEESEA